MKSNKTKPIIVLIPGHRTNAVLTNQVVKSTHSVFQVHDDNFKCSFFQLPYWLRKDGFKVYFADYENDARFTDRIEALGAWFGQHILSIATKHPNQQILNEFPRGRASGVSHEGRVQSVR